MINKPRGGIIFSRNDNLSMGDYLLICVSLVLLILVAVHTSCYHQKSVVKIEQFDQQAAITDPNSLPPSLTLYWTSWCPFAKKIMKEWDLVTQNYVGTQLRVLAIDGDENPDLVKAANVRSFPTIVLTKDGVATEYMGERTAAAIARFVELS